MLFFKLLTVMFCYTKTKFSFICMFLNNTQIIKKKENSTYKFIECDNLKCKYLIKTKLSYKTTYLLHIYII